MNDDSFTLRSVPEVTVAFCPRERFEAATEALARIVEHSDVPFHLIWVDCSYPQSIREKIEGLLQNVSHEVIHLGRFSLPNEAANLAIQRTRTKYLAVIQNDLLVGPKYLSKGLNSLREFDADVVTPLILEGSFESPHVHFDQQLGYVEPVPGDAAERIVIRRRSSTKDQEVNAAPRREQFVETHCLFFRSSVFEKAGLLDETINTSEEIDLSLALLQAGARVWFDPRIQVHFLQPEYPVASIDRPYFSFKWDPQKAHATHEYLMKKWRLLKMPQDLGFVEERFWFGTGDFSPLHWEFHELSQCGPLILADQCQWLGSPATDGLVVWPFLERDGVYYGAPPDDAVALAELERMMSVGAKALVFSWHTFWYFEHFKHFTQAIRRRFPVIRQNAHLIAFDLAHPNP